MELVFWYKIVCLVVGLLIIYLGYNLFIKGVFKESGDVEGSFKNYKLMIRKAAPGTYFVVFGSIIIGMIVFKGFSAEDVIKKGTPGNTSIQKEMLKDTTKFH